MLLLEELMPLEAPKGVFRSQQLMLEKLLGNPKSCWRKLRSWALFIGICQVVVLAKF